MQAQTDVLLHSEQIRIICSNSHVQIYTYTRMQERRSMAVWYAAQRPA